MNQCTSDNTAQIGSRILRWYDCHCRDLPWRIPPQDIKNGQRPRPYDVWLSEIMLQQTTVATVIPYYRLFMQRWPDVHCLAAAKDSDVMAAWAGLGYYARARNMLKTARYVSETLAGIFPGTEAGLQKLAGIGPYTAAAISVIAFGRRATVMDGNIERVMARLFLVRAPLPGCKPELHKLATIATPASRIGDYVQAVMDLGALICTPRNPKCDNCPLAMICCARIAGLAHELPARNPKPAKPVRNGLVYYAYNSVGQVLLETRPNHGLLGGMLCLPASEWIETTPEPDPPVHASWHEAPQTVQHIFTHFKLILSVKIALVDGGKPLRGKFMVPPDMDDFPGVMRKAIIMALKNIEKPSKSG